jgi:hypothetical protein
LAAGVRGPGAVSPETRVGALQSATAIAQRLGDFAGSIALAEESLSLCRELGDEAGSLDTLRILAGATEANGDSDRTRTPIVEAIRRATRLSDTTRVYRLTHQLGELELRRGNVRRASELLEGSSALAREAGDFTTLSKPCAPAPTWRRPCEIILRPPRSTAILARSP